MIYQGFGCFTRWSGDKFHRFQPVAPAAPEIETGPRHARADIGGCHRPCAATRTMKIATAITRDHFKADGSAIVVIVRDEERPLFEIGVNLSNKDLRQLS